MGRKIESHVFVMSREYIKAVLCWELWEIRCRCRGLLNLASFYSLSVFSIVLYNCCKCVKNTFNPSFSDWIVFWQTQDDRFQSDQQTTEVLHVVGNIGNTKLSLHSSCLGTSKNCRLFLKVFSYESV